MKKKIEQLKRCWLNHIGIISKTAFSSQKKEFLMVMENEKVFCVGVKRGK